MSLHAMLRRGRLGTTAALAVVLVIGLQPAPASAAPSKASFKDQKVIELTKKAGTRTSASGLAYHHTEADRVSATNVAVAYASCDGCRAVSLSFQVVLADQGPEKVDARNVAVAVNEKCRRCETLALAYQVVVTSDRRTRLSGQGRVGIAWVRHRLDGLARSGKPLPEIREDARELMDVVAVIVKREVHSKPVVRSKERWDRD
jgi:putative peptide zinc metalloprotease protein